MKHVKKIFAVAMALFVALAVVALPAFAEGTGTITITLPTDPAPTGTTTYNIYKVFDATSDGSSSAIAYKLISGDKASFEGDTSGIANYFSVDAAGNVRAKPDAKGTDGKLTAGAIAAIGTYAKNLTGNVTQAVANAGDTTVTAEVGFGYFYIDTTTGTAVTIDSTNPNAAVDDKNSLTTIVKSLGTEYDKDSMKAIAQVGNSETFTASITLGKGAKNVVFSDAMNHMTYNGDVAVKIGNEVIAAGETTYTVTGEEGAASFTVTFNNDFIAGYAENTVINLTYSGKIGSGALYNDPATNTATITTGDNNNFSQTTEPVKVYTAQIAVNKTKGENQPLQGAGFVLKNADNKYYKFANGVVTWVDNITDADEHVSGTDGKVAAFTGLDNGTYKLEEKTVPASYNKALDTEVVIADGNYEATNLNQTKAILNQQGTEMPSTGGIGTTIFYVVGGVMVAGAAIFLLTKRRMAGNQD